MNFRDNLVATGVFPAADGLIPLSDGAGEVVETGHGVTEFKVGDAVISTFHPLWLDGQWSARSSATHPEVLQTVSPASSLPGRLRISLVRRKA